jgi:death on curing protein
MIPLHKVLWLHKLAIQHFGGSDGVRDWSALKSALERPFQTFDGIDLYHSPLSKGAALLESILVNHPFIDGNKRTAYVMLRYFLRLNHLDITASEDEKYDLIIEVASGKLKYNDIINWLSKHISQLK